MKFSESDFEDIAAKQPSSITGHDNAVTIGRQVRLPSGARVDLLMFHIEEGPNDGLMVMWVVELKRDKADIHTVMQIQGYMGELAGCWNNMELRGVIAAPEIPPEVRSAVAGNPNLYTCDIFVDVWFPGLSDESPPACNPELIEILDPLVLAGVMEIDGLVQAERLAAQSRSLVLLGDGPTRFAVQKGG